jgi:cell division protein FtsI/penicillin-binding protein 2
LQEYFLVWSAHLLLIGIGVIAAFRIGEWMREAVRAGRERWAVRVAGGMIVLAGAYAAGHVWILANRSTIEAGRDAYALYGDPRRTELRRAEVRGWIVGCEGDAGGALALYRARGDGFPDRAYPLGEAGANLIGGGEDGELRDFTVERLFASQLRQPRSLRERGQLHPAGTDLHLTLCAGLTAEAWRLLRASGRPGAVVMQDVATGAVVAYAATGSAEDAPLGIRQYAAPGSVFKLALAALWWEGGMPPSTVLPCPPSVEVAPGAVISNYGGADLGSVEVPTGMLVPSCNTAAVLMAQQMRERLGEQAFLDAYRAYGFIPYETDPPGVDREFWSTGSSAWERRMSPSASRLRMSERTGAAEWAQLAIGQGPLDVTVIGVSRFLQAIGNGGEMVRPTLEPERAARPERVERVMSAQTAERLQGAMLETVRSGTARAALPRMAGTGWALGGKTGTAQVAGRSDDGWFAGLVHDDRGVPRYTVVAYLRGGGPGGAGPTAIAAGLASAAAREGR